VVGHHHASLVPLHQHEVGFTTTDILQALRGQGFASDCSGSRFDCILGSWHRHVGCCGTSRKGGCSCSHWNQKCILDHGLFLRCYCTQKIWALYESRLNEIMAADVNKSNIVFPIDQDRSLAGVRRLFADAGYQGAARRPDASAAETGASPYARASAGRSTRKTRSTRRSTASRSSRPACARRSSTRPG
jgi:hypothetical protein